MNAGDYRKCLPAGSIIFSEGEAGDCAYIIDLGEISLSTCINGDHTPFAKAKRGDLIGEMALIDEGVRSATATVISDAELLVIPKEYIQRLIEGADPTVVLLIKLVLERYREMRVRVEQISRGEPLGNVHSAPKVERSFVKKQTSIAARRLDDEQNLRLALQNDELRLFYQPIVDLKTGRMLGCEALIRWLHPEKGIIPPIGFLPLIDETDLEILIGEWVINQALKQLDEWRKQDVELEVSINIASYHLQSANFIRNLELALEHYPEVDSTQFQIEILESSALGDLQTVSTILKTCQKVLGINIALDDFGTGYSSLTHLRSLPANTIKIDQSFVRNILNDPSDYTIIDGIIGLSDSFNRNVIAEGVETSEHGLMLLMMGCDRAQGYGIAKPMPANNVLEWLSEYKPNEEWKMYGKKHRSHKENQVKVFRLITEHWNESFVHNIHSSAGSIEHWPIMDAKHCPCGAWIEQAEQEQLFEEGLESFKQAHEEVHLIANAIFLKYQEGDIEVSRSVLHDFRIAYNDMSNALGKCV